MRALYRCRENNAAAARERVWTCCLVAGVVIDEVTERASPKCGVPSEGQSEVGWRSECNQREDSESESLTTNVSKMSGGILCRYSMNETKLLHKRGVCVQSHQCESDNGGKKEFKNPPAWTWWNGLINFDKQNFALFYSWKNECWSVWTLCVYWPKPADARCYQRTLALSWKTHLM